MLMQSIVNLKNLAEKLNTIQLTQSSSHFTTTFLKSKKQKIRPQKMWL